jgi:hypothetical protein
MRRHNQSITYYQVQAQFIVSWDFNEKVYKKQKNGKWFLHSGTTGFNWGDKNPNNDVTACGTVWQTSSYHGVTNLRAAKAWLKHCQDLKMKENYECRFRIVKITRTIKTTVI